METISLSKGNTKLNKGIVSFSIPPVSTCPNAGECFKFCYAKKSYRIYKKTKKAYDTNLNISKSPEFLYAMKYEISKLKGLMAFRLHVSGDFYNQEYFNKWVDIIKEFPNITFYTYTKTFWLDLSKKPKNFIVIYSYGGRIDKKEDWAKSKGFNGIASINDIGTIAPESKSHKGFKVCREKCGTNCDYCFKKGTTFKKVAFIKH